MLGLEEVQAARERIAGRVRCTPLVAASPAREAPPIELALKLENLQVTGSFKARGAANKVLSLPAAERRRGLVTASGGNHGLGVAYAGWLAAVPATIYLPANAPAAKAAAVERWGARVRHHGEVWDDAHEAALAAAAAEGLVYVHPFADPAVIAGQGTAGLEIREQAPEADLVVVAIGGGGLISGVALAIKSLAPQVRVVGVEPAGAPTLHASIAAGELVELAEVRTAASSLAPRRSAEINLGLVRRYVDEVVLVDDEEIGRAAGWLWREMGVAAELSGAAAVAAVLAGRIDLSGVRQACALVCGAGTAGLAD